MNNNKNNTNRIDKHEELCRIKLRCKVLDNQAMLLSRYNIKKQVEAACTLPLEDLCEMETMDRMKDE